jgi:lysozyme family protein
VPTPYLWSFSNHYERGKFVADGKFSSTARSQQCGAAVMLKLLAEAGEIKLEAAA